MEVGLLFATTGMILLVLVSLAAGMCTALEIVETRGNNLPASTMSLHFTSKGISSVACPANRTHIITSRSADLQPKDVISHLIVRTKTKVRVELAVT